MTAGRYLFHNKGGLILYLLQQIINGLCQGSIYALMAIGYTMIYGVVGLVSFCYGEIVMVGAFGAYYAFLYSGQLIPGILFGFACAAFLGIFLHKLCYERFLDSPRHISMICTVGFSMLVKNLAQIFFGSVPQPTPTVFDNVSYNFAGLTISKLQIIIMCVVIIFVIAFTFFLNKTRAGLKLRAVSQDKKASALVGIDVKKTTLFGSCLGCALGGVAGTLLAIYYTSVYPTMGAIVGNKALSATVLGGLVSISGSAMGGLVIGVLENIGIMFIPTGLRDVIAFVFLVLVLIFKPQGLFAKRRISR